MNKFLMSVAAVIASLAVVSTVHAGGNKGGNKPSGSSHPQVHNIQVNYKQLSNPQAHLLSGARKFSFGYCFPRSYCNWSYTCWSPQYCCNYYWCPSTCCYYYYCAPQACYYPISYISYAPPQATATATATVSQVVNVQNGVGGPAGPQVQGGAPPAAPQGAGPVQPYVAISK